MSKVKISTIKKVASKIKKNVKKNNELPKFKHFNEGQIANLLTNAVLSPKTQIKHIKVKKPSSTSDGTHISRQVNKTDYIDMATRISNYIKKNGQAPNNVVYKDYKISYEVYTDMFARIVNYFYKKGKFPKQVNVNSKAFDKTVESAEQVYNYFCKVLNNGKNVKTVDDALKLLDSKGYGFYYDDTYSNKQSIDRVKNRQGINCTDSMQVMMNVVNTIIKKYGTYKKVECIHVRCRSSGTGHVRMRILMKDGAYIYRDPASVLDGSGVTSNWCLNGILLAVNPSWFMTNLNR